MPTEQVIAGGHRRTMDCMRLPQRRRPSDFADRRTAVDRAIAAGEISRQLPFVRREGVRLLKASYPAKDEGVQGIDRELRNFYRSQKASVDEQALSRAVASLQDVYRRNVFPPMKVTWGVYPDNKGHMTSSGCFRCHDDTHAAKDGTKISADCEYLPQTDREAGRRSGWWVSGKGSAVSGSQEAVSSDLQTANR